MLPYEEVRLANSEACPSHLMKQRGSNPVPVTIRGSGEPPQLDNVPRSTQTRCTDDSI